MACDLRARVTQHSGHRLLYVPSRSHHLCQRPTVAITSAMDDLREQIELFESSANLSASIDNVQRAIDMLAAAREKIAAGTSACRGT